MTSFRGKAILANRDIIDDIWVPKQMANSYDPDINPQGIINLCVAENKLCEDIICAKINECMPKQTDADWLYYASHPYGTISFRQAVCGVINEFFKPRTPVTAEQVVTVAGAVTVMSTLCMSIADPGDYMLCLAPYYYRIRQDMFDEAGVKFYDVPMIQKSHFEDSGSYGASQIEKYYLKAVSEGFTVRGLVIINPDNPSGKIYSSEEITDILRVCEKYGLHAIVDEIYALTRYGDEPFTSILSIPNLPNIDRTHFMWGLSKDFCMNGYRCGVMVTYNEDILNCVKAVSCFHTTPVQTQDLLTSILSDTKWIREIFLPTNRKRLQKSYKTVTKFLDDLNIPHYKGQAGFYVWADFSKFLRSTASDDEFEFFKECAEEGVLVNPGTRFFTSERGCVRLVFTVPYNHLIESLKRIKVVCERRNKEKTTS